MAQGIITCTGEQFNIGDKVRTPDGTVIRVEGAALGMKFHNAEECQHCDPSEPTTKERNEKAHKDANKHSGGEDVKPVGGGQGNSDCIIWGT